MLLQRRRPSTEPAPRPTTVEDRWILSRLQAAKAADRRRASTAFDFSKAALGLYDFVYGELCDWYLEFVKGREYDARPARRRCSTSCARRSRSRTRSSRSSPRSCGRHVPGSEGLLADGAHAGARRGAARRGRRGARWPPSIEAVHGAARVARRGGRQARRRCCPRALRRARRRPPTLVARLARLDLVGRRRADGDRAGPGRQRSRSAPATLVDPRGGGPQGAPPSASALQREIARAEAKLANEGFVAKAPPDRRRRPSATSSSACARSSPGCSVVTDRRGRALPAVPRAVRHALRPGPHAPADDRARARRRSASRSIHVVGHERQVARRCG